MWSCMVGLGMMGWSRFGMDCKGGWPILALWISFKGPLLLASGGVGVP